jgi:Protein of unknown function (DUF3043)
VRFRRRTSEAALADEPAETVTLGKGRPTPKRRETSPKRGPVSAPRTRKEAAQRQRQQARAARSGKPGASMSSTEYRQALRRGDESVLSRRDRGPVRKLARDWVDSRRMMSNFLLFLFPVMIAGYVLPVINVVVLVLFAAFLAEWYITGRRIRTLAISRFGANAVSTGPWSIGFYAGSRAYLPRRFRVPAPQVSLGEAV